MRFLIDECLTVELAVAAWAMGYEAHHVAHLGKRGWRDWNIRDYAISHDFVVVTNNASDFRALYGSCDLHPGLVMLVPTMRDHQARPAPDLVERNFSAAAPNRVWVADITYIPT